MPKIMFEHDGETISADLGSVELPEGFRVLAPGEVPDGFYTKDTLDATVNKSWGKKFRKLKSDLGEAREILEAHGVPLDEEGNVAIPETEDFDPKEEREKIKRAILKEEVDPLRTELEEKSNTVQSLLGARKNAEILQAASAHGVMGWALKAPTDDEGAAPPIVHMASPYLGYEGDNDMFAVRNGDGFAPATKEGKPWAGVSDLFDRLAKDPSYAHLFKDTQPGATNLGGTDGTSSSDFPDKRSEFTRQQRLDFLEKQRQKGNDAKEAWKNLPR